MARIPQPTDFRVEVEDVGTFVFARRTMRDEIAIQVEYARIIDGVTPTEWLAVVAGWTSTLRVLTVSAPKDWDIDGLDPLDSATYLKIKRVCDALDEKERSFRRGTESQGQAGSQAAD